MATFGEIEEARENPGKRFRDPRFPSDIQSCAAPVPVLGDYLVAHFPEFEFIGPEVRRGVTLVKDRLIVQADLMQNGLPDCLAVIREVEKPSARVVAFLRQLAEGPLRLGPR